jgi:solute carrier family 25 (mitochondrial oxoglutarate transporter), member 11
MSNNSTPLWFSFASAGTAGAFAWCIVHPFNTASIRMNLASGSAKPGVKPPSFFPFLGKMLKEKGIASLYDGLGAGVLRQLVYATARIGLFDVFRDEIAKHREIDFGARLVAGLSAGGCAALLSCPCEVTLVRLSNDALLPVADRRGYTGIVNAFTRIMKEEGFGAFFRGSAPFVNRALLVGLVQVGTYEQFRVQYRKMGLASLYANVMVSSFSAGLLYSLVTNPFETVKNRMAFQKPDPVTGDLMYKSTVQTMQLITKNEGAGMLWAGFLPYFLRCGGHTVTMFMVMEWMRKIYAGQKK